jgi:aminoglycoside phosphotransferase (APT) family kinase protein
MALSNKTDPVEAERRLTEWLGRKLPDADEVRVHGVEVPSASGLSTETILFGASWRSDAVQHDERLVARVEPSGPAVFPSYDLETEFKVIKAVGEQTNVPAPKVLWHEGDPSVLGAPFVVMERLDGRVASDDPPFTTTGWVLELSPEQQATLCDNALRAMTDIHRADWKALGLGFLDRPDLGATALDQQLAYWENTFEWAAEGDSNPTVEAAFDWIAENRPPEDEPLVLNWGDARLGNLLIADDLSVAGVLDWEMVALASPELELGWWLLLLRHHTEGIGAPMPPGFPSREETIARYEELTGHAVKHIDFYEAFAALRLSILMHRAGNMMTAAGLLPRDAPMKLCNPASQLLAKLAGLPAPEGLAQSFIGNR